MKFEVVDTKGREIKVTPENLDDLWHLYNIIRPGDLVFGYTLRRLSERQDVSRS
ncbi:MAG: mRNA surveillance protein Pelota, partial [Euryarchaeota archaeon]|nr:mRNA surveillance protein Pelota [Euryarchaeota archaeon]